MKQLHSILAVLFLSVFMLACSKKDADVTPPPAPYVVEGIYSGKIGTGAAIPASQFELNLKPDGTIERIIGNGTVTGTGSWQLKGDAFTAHYESNVSSTVIDLKGTLQKEKKRISGSWVNNGGNEGTYYVTKK